MRPVTWSPIQILDGLRPHSRWYREVDAYVDRELAPRPLAAFETHLRGCRHCSVAVDERRSLKRAVSAMPAPVVPRSFRLSPEMVAIRLPTVPDRRAPRLALALAALAIVGLVSTVVVDLNGSGHSGTLATAPSTFQVSTASGDTAAGPVSNQAAPPQAATARAISAPSAAIGPVTPESAGPRLDSGQKAVAPPVPAASTGDHRLRTLEIGSGALAVACIGAALVMRRNQRRRNS